MRRWKTWTARAAVLFAALGSSELAEPAAEVQAVVSFSILADWVREIGGDRVRVTTLVGPDGDVHVYEPTPNDVRAITNADIVFVNGLGFEGWIDRLARSSDRHGRVAKMSAGLKTIANDSFDHRHAGIDPHAWHSVPNAMIYVRNIAAALCETDSAGCAGYQRRAERYIAQLEMLDQWIRAEIDTVPAARRRVITSHAAFAYFGLEYGVTFLAPQGVNTESDPSAADVARLIRQIRHESAGALFVENISDPRLLAEIARETGLKPGGRLYSDALSVPGEGAGTYLEMMRRNVTTLVAGMRR